MDTLKQVFQHAKATGQGVMIVTIPRGAIRKIFCPYCGQPYSKHEIRLQGQGALQERCRSRWCGTITREDSHTETAIFFHTEEGDDAR